MLRIFFHAKHVQDNVVLKKQNKVVLKVSNLDLTITSQPIEI